MSDDAPTEVGVTFRTEYFRDSVVEFRDAVEELCRAAEELRGAAIYYDDPVTGRPASVGFGDMFDLSAEISIQPTNYSTVYCDQCGQEVDPTHE